MEQTLKQTLNQTLHNVIALERRGAEILCQPLEPLTLANAARYEAALNRLSEAEQGLVQPKRPVGATLTLDFARIDDYDSYCVVWLTAVRRLCANHDVPLHIVGMSSELLRFIELLERPLKCDRVEEQPESSLHRYIANLGSATLGIAGDARAFIEFTGELSINAAAALRSPTSVRWAELPAQFTRAGVDAVPIVVLIGFLMGVIVGYQGAMQLAQFGAEIYLADMVAISMCRELAPLMTAIIIAGRSGAAFAAELGTMQVSEEIDALKAMGFNIMRFLVLPRVMAVMLAMPILVLFADLAGMAGGLLIGVTVSKISFSGYINETRYAMTYGHLFSGLIKSVVLGIIVASIGCMRGLQVSGGAESVGRFTTLAVVTGIFLIIVADALFTLMFQAIGF